MDKRCVVCGRPTTTPIVSALEHFKPYRPGMWQYLRGNVATFGAWGGIMGTFTLAFPWFNTIKNWRYRHHRLTGLE